MLQATLAADGFELPPGQVRIDRFGDSAASSDALLALIRDGKKRAGTSLFGAYRYDGVDVPRAGDVAIVLDRLDRPVFVTRDVRVDVLPLRDVTAAQAAVEGEGDGSLAYWRDAHWPFLVRESLRIGCEPSDTMPVVFCEFVVLHASRRP